MLNCRYWLVVPVLSLAMPLALAAGDPKAEGWSGEAELGFVMTTGNTDTRSLNAKGLARYKKGPWLNELNAEVLKASDESGDTAERYMLAGKGKYFFKPRDYLFGTLRYVDDRFSGYEYQVTEAVGYGHRFIEKDNLTLDIEGGVGGSHAKPEVGERQDSAIVRGAASLAWTISDSARFTEELLVESGSDNTFSESVSAIKLKINSSLAMKVSLTVRHNSDVPADTEKTDTITAVNLVYDF